MFELDYKEFNDLRSQIGTSSWGGTRYKPMAFTEHGVLMLASVLSSERAVQINIQIMRIFTKMREMLATHKDILRKLEEIEKKYTDHDQKIMLIFEYLKQLEKTKQEDLELKPRKKIGFKRSKEE
jgi:phage regulator Rha-like protein